MKKISLLILLSFTVSGCSFIGKAGSGEIISRQLSNSDFSAIEVGNTCQLEVIQASEYSVTIYCDDNIFNDIEIYHYNNTLKLSLNEYTSYYNITFRVVVNMPDITDFKLTGASSLEIENFNSNSSLYGKMSGASQADINFNTTSDMQFDLSGASDMTMEGECRNLTLKSSGASEESLSGLQSQNADIALSGASTALVRLNGILSFDISGASSLTTTGNITSISSQSISGASKYNHN